ncbi:hypothetical protein FRB09_01395 [Haemophilus influenzae]|uniref:Uncharacterized protein n=1 Tax=Haemophilus influenzae TaxID=727 RepID=A0A346KCD5_HAEIF|nr:hypothetical protein CH628_01540 [Haemophilus influenzae]AXP46717.1 hypothetical protein CH639_01295 [Haemophilus influenzae]AXP60355.1 hypothetical protein CH597_01285 [Haemophilus influenzae]AXP63851.1 hypothetical protein CH578_01285 [Haemophilus influenzae]AXP65564.1 hypothetical protein CH635_01290 [Haemophilus influenzae]
MCFQARHDKLCTCHCVCFLLFLFWDKFSIVAKFRVIGRAWREKNEKKCGENWLILNIPVLPLKNLVNFYRSLSLLID